MKFYLQRSLLYSNLGRWRHGDGVESSGPQNRIYNWCVEWNEETCAIIAYQLCSIDSIYRQNETDIYIITYFCIYSFRYFMSTLYYIHMVNTKTPRNHLWKEVLLKHQAPLKRVLVLINQIGNETLLSSCFFYPEIELWYGWSVGGYDSWKLIRNMMLLPAAAELYVAQVVIENIKRNLAVAIFQRPAVSFREFLTVL